MFLRTLQKHENHDRTLAKFILKLDTHRELIMESLSDLPFLCTKSYENLGLTHPGPCRSAVHGTKHLQTPGLGVLTLLKLK
jgi:hypothetical protein